MKCTLTPCQTLQFLCRLQSIEHIGITLSGVCLSVFLSVCPCVCLSISHTFLVVTHRYVSQATRAFLGMLPLCLIRKPVGSNSFAKL